MKFTKMHGAGNDYIYVNAMQEQVADPSSLSVRLSDRHKGIGSDGLVLILPSDKADFRMRMFNSDGSEAEMCGNASRCIAKYVYDKGLTNKQAITLETKAGIKQLSMQVEDGFVSSVRVDMGEPILDPDLIPVKTSQKPVIKLPLIVENNHYEITCVSMGNPHAVLFMEGIDQLDLPHIGPLFEHHSLFPVRTNTEFVEVINRSHVKMRVWERGAGETLACGTGACAVLVAGVLCGLIDPAVDIDLLGGRLRIEWNRETNHVYMTGGATTVFEGEVE
ncbi:MAG: diaminopimelate epimerase [Bacteroidota bacterium]|nr:diaminopimelate epimerase [Bacteroidota bacterium]